jgi:signal transduction histidine kinase/CheY-like chemotaxis protein
MTGAVPITEVGPPPAAVALALDINASYWNAAIARARLPAILITLLIAGMSLFFFAAQQRAHEVTALRMAETHRISRQKTAIVRMATSPHVAGADFKRIAQEITELASDALDVERTGVWLGSAEKRRLTCVDLFERGPRRHSEGLVLEATPYPRYFEALATGRAIDAHNALNDPRTQEFRDVYLTPLGITSMLDAPIRISGRVVGVVCFEHIGPPRMWQNDEIRFAAETADQAAQALANTERHKAEEAKHKYEQQMQYSQKLESLGVLAGGIAHDFNNMLMIILGNIELALAEVPPASNVSEKLREVEAISRRAADLCRQLLAYAGKGRFVIQPVDLNKMIQEMQNMFEVSVSKKAVLRCEMARTLPAVEADYMQMQQVLMNLVINASESLQDREGVITVSTTSRRFDSKELAAPWSAEPLPEGEYVVLQVSDTGCGMSPEVRARIFEPFFTTKFSGRGLGLAAVMGIVQRHKGTIHVYSEVGRGSVFRVLLPASQQTAVAQPPTEAPDHWKASGTVLVVDDERPICRITKGMLAPCGLKVLTASDGREALELLRQHSHEIKCVLLDLTMPRMDGAETLQEIRKIRGDLPVVLMSGFTEQVIAERVAAADHAVFIEKPYSRARLIETLKKLIVS